jgi:hypothetical protein
MAYAMVGEVERARDALTEALRFKPDDATIHTYLKALPPPAAMAPAPAAPSAQPVPPNSSAR